MIKVFFNVPLPFLFVVVKSEDDPVVPIVKDKPVVDDWDEKSLDGVNPETYFSLFMEILEKINTPNKNFDRLKFHTFLDLCWETVGFDMFSLGINELVFDQETCPDSNSYSMANKVQPYKLRELFLDRIKKYFIEQSELANIDDLGVLEQINKHFQGVGNSLILIQSTIL
jgi:hypothetical protein